MLNSMPNFFDASDRIKALWTPNSPITKFDYSFDSPDMSQFLLAYEGMIDSGNLFTYEDYDYLDNGRLANNLTECRNLYGKIADGWEFKRRERIKTGQNLNFTVFNKTKGWFPEIAEACPDLVNICDGYVDKFNIDVWKILVFKVDTNLVWHMDVDGYYGFRLYLTKSDDWTLTFREVKSECKVLLRDMTWQGQWNEVNDTVDQTTFGPDIPLSDADLGQAFLIDSINYVHYFSNPKPFYGVLVKGVV